MGPDSDWSVVCGGFLTGAPTTTTRHQHGGNQHGCWVQFALLHSALHHITHLVTVAVNSFEALTATQNRLVPCTLIYTLIQDPRYQRTTETNRFMSEPAASCPTVERFPIWQANAVQSLFQLFLVGGDFDGEILWVRSLPVTPIHAMKAEPVCTYRDRQLNNLHQASPLKWRFVYGDLFPCHCCC